jgi:hypothetical protein
MIASISAEQIATAKSIGIVVLFCIAVVALAVCSVIAFVKRSRGWIIAGSITGILFLVLMGIAVAGVIRGIYMARADQERRDSASNTKTPGGGDTRIVTGRKVGYSISIPEGWTIEKDFKNWDLYSQGPKSSVAVMAESTELNDINKVALLVRQNYSTTGSDPEWTKSTETTIDGRTWLQFEMKCERKGTPLTFVFHVYTGSGGTFQIIGNTYQKHAESELPRLKEIANSFRFPKASQ